MFDAMMCAFMLERGLAGTAHGIITTYNSEYFELETQ